MGIEAVYITQLVLTRPFIRYHLMAIELINEVFFMCFIIAFYIIDKQREWTGGVTRVVLIVLFMNTIIITIILIAHAVFSLCKKIFKKKKNLEVSIAFVHAYRVI